MKAWFAAIALLFAAPALAVAQPQDISRPGTVPHAAARAGFPEQVGEFRRTHVLRFGENDISANYDLRRDGALLRLSIYIYPAPHVPRGDRVNACRAEMENIQAGIVDNHERARRLESGEAPALPETEAGLRLRVLHNVPMMWGDEFVDIRRESILYCYVGGDWLVKYFASASPRFPAAEIGPAIDAFMRAGPWPGRGVGAIASR